ncbi:hypothetical protein ACWDVV_40930, partial [Streptomyces tendae]
HAEKLPEDGTLVVVSHGGTIRTTIGRLLGLERFGGRLARAAALAAGDSLVVRRRAGGDGSGTGLGHDITACMRGCEGCAGSEELERE